MGISATASIEIHLIRDSYDTTLKQFCKNILGDSDFFSEVYQFSYHKEYIMDGERRTDKTVHIAKLSLDNRNFWVSRFGLIFLKHIFLGNHISSEQVEEEAQSKTQNDRLMDFCKTVGCLTVFEESSFEAASRERTIATADEVLSFEEDKTNENYDWVNEDFGKVQASEFYENLMIKSVLNGESLNESQPT